ncbi:MAG TPA: YbjN domain-containing protein [Gemmataceae bacterium]|nr:YbjN domain-containing protein [Gemmataceae bacterium]
MGQLFEAVVDYLTEDDWKFQVVKDDTALMLSFRGEAGSWQCFATVDEEKQWFTFYSILPSNVPEEKRVEITEFITRANYGLVIGNFEMDYGDGEVRYKTSVDVEGGELTPKMIENLMRANLMTMDRYFAGVMGVLYGDRDPAEAIAEMEEDGHEHDEDVEDMDFGGEEDDDEEDEGNGFGSGPETGIKPPDDPTRP